MKLLTLIIFSMVFAVPVGYARDLRYESMTDNEKRLKTASELIKAFETEKEPERLREASQELENVDLRREHDKQIRHKQRSSCLEMWLTLLQVIDKNLDSSFDAEDVPKMSVMPPKTKDGIQFPPGASPSVITDPQARQDYEKAVKENREKQENYLMQTQLVELNEQFPEKVDTFIRNAYTASTLDKNEVKAAIDRIIENETRKATLHQALAGRSED